MKKILMIALLALLTVNMNCGGGGSSSDISARTMVTINLGEVRDASSLSTSERGIVSTSSIPPHVVAIRITISAPDMPTIVEVIPTAGLTSDSVTIEVPNGPNRQIVCEALNDTDGVLYRGETYVTLDGTPAFVSIVMSADPIPPVFAGISDITSITQTSMVLSWSPATDNVTPQNKIQYLIYMATTSGGQNFASPSFTTPLGATSYTVTGLNPDTTYYYVVLAMDEIGNKSTTIVEASGTTLAPPDPTPPTFGGLESATALSATSIELQWSEATDDRTPSADIVYLIYMATTSGGQNFATPTATTSPGVTSYIMTGLSQDTTYYYVVRAKDAAGNTDTNTVERSATTSSLSLEAFSQHWPDGYYGQFQYDDPEMTASSVSVEGPGIEGSLALTYGGVCPACWASSPGSLYFGSTYPTPPPEYTFTVTDSTGTWNATDTIDCFMTEFATNLSPSGTITGTPATFSWNLVPQTNVVYSVALFNSSEYKIWDGPELIDASSVPYSGPSLTPGMDYYYYVMAKPQGYDCSSWKNEFFFIGFIDLRPINDGFDTSLIYCDVENTGVDDALNVEVWFDYNDDCVSTNCDDITPFSVPGMSTQPASHAFAFTPVYYRIIVDPNNLIQESDETNNCVSNHPTMCLLPLPSDCSGM